MNVSPEVKSCQSHGWLDKLAISMSVICALHCLVTPLIVTLLPIISTTFWVHENFHLWMVFLVVPTTTAAMFMGCRKHKDKTVASLGAIGLAFIVFVAIYQYSFYASNPDAVCGVCPSCTQLGLGSFFNITNVLNSLGGLFLACAHVRNYKLCRKARCDHD